nr:hypothetical protein [Parafrankia sp. Ea1.12]
MDQVGGQVIFTADHQWSFSFTGSAPPEFSRLVRLVAQPGGDGIAAGGPGRHWAPSLPDRTLLSPRTGGIA